MNRNVWKFIGILLAVVSTIVIRIDGAGAAYPSTSVKLRGHGYGHGRGMGQYGALGYAVNKGYSYTKILERFYSNTSSGSVSNSTIGVRLTRNESEDLIVTSNNEFDVEEHEIDAGDAIRVKRTGPNEFRVYTSASCAGPWTSRWTYNESVDVTPGDTSPGDNENYMLRRCTTSDTRGYRGSLRAYDDSGSMRTINRVALESYLRGVVPRESPASWGDLSNGMAALRAQAVAARSYASAEDRYPYAKTCDSTSCQVYGGAFLNGVRIEHDNTNDAISDTSGKIRRLNGNPARTEFSSSTGGYSAGGTFPAVSDAGDSIASNSNHTWTTSISVTAVQNTYSLGTLQNISITLRNGKGDMGGRVVSMKVIGSSKTVTVTGNEFRSHFGLKSDWFEVTNAPTGNVGGYFINDSRGKIYSFGNADYKGGLSTGDSVAPVIGMDVNATGSGYWILAENGGIFTFGSASFYGSTGGIRLNKPIVGMAATPNGKGYWLVASDGGIFSFGNARFYGSTGGMRLNQPIVGMAPTATGKGYWLVASDGGIFSFGDARFYGSTGGIRLSQPIVGIATLPTGKGYWMVAKDGGVFSFGGAKFYGSGASRNKAFTDIEPTFTGKGYFLSATDGYMYTFGDAPDLGDIKSANSAFSNGALQIQAVEND